MKRAIKVGCAVTLATAIICYFGIRKELLLAKHSPATPIRLAGETGAR